MTGIKGRIKMFLGWFLKISAVLLAALLLFAYSFTPGEAIAPVAGYMLSFIFVGSNFLVVRNFREVAYNKFYKRFITSLGIRFVLVLAVFILLLLTLEIHQIYFTVSFIISYILHSGIEIISIHKLLEKDN